MSLELAILDDTLYIGTEGTVADTPCSRNPSVPDAALGLDAFYAEALNAEGIPVPSSANVEDRALVQACTMVLHMLPRQPTILEAMVERTLRVAVIGPTEVLTDIPEYRDLYAVFPFDDWDGLRGVGATLARPVSSVGQENLLCSNDDENGGESLLPQTFSHGRRALGIEPTDAAFRTRLKKLLEEALAADLWKGTYASSGPDQYFAEGIQDWLDANSQTSPADGVHNAINTRAELKAYDPALASLIGEYLLDDAFRPRCP